MNSNSALNKCIKWSLLILLSFALVGASLRIEAQEDRVTSDWQPNGTMIAYIAAGRLNLFDTVSAQNLNILQSVPSDMFIAVWSPDGTKLAASDSNGAIYIWSIASDASTGELLTILRGFENTVTSLAWSAAGQWLAAARWDGLYTVQVWDMNTFQPILRAKTGNTYKVSWTPTGNVLAISTIGGTYSVNFDQMNTSSPMNFATFPEFAAIATQIGPSDAAVPISWSPDGTRIAIGNFDGTIRVFNIATSAEVTSLENTDVVTTLKWSPDGSHLAGAVRDGKVLVWETSTYQIIANFQSNADIPLLSFSPFGGRLVFGNFTSTDLEATTVAGDALQIVVPAPSLERLQTIADACNAPIAIEQSLTASLQADQLSSFITQVEALTENAIPPACAADLIAVAEALQSR